MQTLLIANRGEIALRVMRSAARLGIQTVALATDLDADAPHARAADRVYRVDSYLDIDQVVAVAEECGADAVHPGYGFLSERSAFAAALEAKGIALVGPSAAVMDAMGRKDAAREIAVTAGVPVVPAYDIDQDPATMSFPVLVKAAAGGGGKGMRVVRSAAEFPEAVAAAAREGLSSFGDDTLIVEKYVERGRHIEVQVLADAHGNTRHLFERDCSTQRRHQKVLEEAPAPTLTADQRELVTSSAVALAEQVGYVNAGTVEFLLDSDTGEAYFLEMNTRLQVEHPVTEAVVRLDGAPIDLVEWQLRITDGQPLPFAQQAVTLQGHSIEARVYAEDSFGGFLPQAGLASYVDWPSGPQVRVDAALESGQEVSTAYDPMLGKVIASGPDRESARAALVAALDHTVIRGLTTNTGFLRVLAASEEFRDATIDTAWLDRTEVSAPDPAPARQVAAAALAQMWQQRSPAGPLSYDGWRDGATAAPVRVQLDEPALILDEPVTVPQPEAGTGRTEVTSSGVEVVHEGQRFVFSRPDPFADRGPVAGDGTLLAPMPGTVLAVHVEPGTVVAEGETLGVLEAMKMELALKAPFPGTVTQVGVAAGEQVALGAVLFAVEARQ